MDGCLAINVDSVIQLEDQIWVLFTGFYGDVDPNQRNESWNMLKRVGGTINKIWIARGDFNVIANNAEKEVDLGNHKLY